jgi:hypothetical protein
MVQYLHFRILKFPLIRWWDPEMFWRVLLHYSDIRWHQQEQDEESKLPEWGNGRPPSSQGSQDLKSWTRDAFDDAMRQWDASLVAFYKDHVYCKTPKPTSIGKSFEHQKLRGYFDHKSDHTGEPFVYNHRWLGCSEPPVVNAVVINWPLTLAECSN